MANAWYCSSVAWSAVTAWANATVAAGVLRRQLAAPATGSERVFASIVGGASGGSEPAWILTKGAKTTDNAITWIEVTGQPGVNGDITNSPVWVPSITPAQGLIIYDSITQSLQVCSTSGAGGTGAAPSFSATAGTTTADASAVWTSLGLASSFAGWSASFARLQSAAAAGWMAAGDSLFIAKNHAETQATAMTVTFPGTEPLPNMMYCVDQTLSVPPVTDTTGATVTTTGNSNMTLAGSFYVKGVAFAAGTSSGAVLKLGSASSVWQKFENCALKKLSTTANNTAINFSTTGAYFELINTVLTMGAALDSIGVATCVLKWKNTLSAIGGTVPSILFGNVADNTSTIILDGVDLSAITGTVFASSSGAATYAYLLNCKLNSAATLLSAASRAGLFLDVVNSGSAANNYQQGRYWYEGTLAVSTSIVRTGGASNGTPLAWNLTTTANALWVDPFKSFTVIEGNSVTGANRTVTLYGIANLAALPTNDQIWIDVDYNGSASSPQGSFVTSTKASNLAAGVAVTADSVSAWDSQATARANTTAYTTSPLSVIKLASNPGRIFFCTAPGTSAGSEPGGYASAVDGGSVTDGGATFRAGVRFSLAVTLSAPQPQMAGYIRAGFRVGQASATFYVDPLINLS